MGFGMNPMMGGARGGGGGRVVFTRIRPQPPLVVDSPVQQAESAVDGRGRPCAGDTRSRETTPWR